MGDKCQTLASDLGVNPPFVLIHHGDTLQPLCPGQAGGHIPQPASAGGVIEAVARVHCEVTHQHQPPAQAPALGQLTRAQHLQPAHLGPGPRLDLNIVYGAPLDDVGTQNMAIFSISRLDKDWIRLSSKA